MGAIEGTTAGGFAASTGMTLGGAVVWLPLLVMLAALFLGLAILIAAQRPRRYKVRRRASSPRRPSPIAPADAAEAA